MLTLLVNLIALVDRRTRMTAADRSARALAIPALPSDEALIARALADDRWARGELYRRYAPDLAAMLTRLLGDREDALDVTHDTYLYVFQRLAVLRDPTRFRSWVFRIAINDARSRLRREKLRRLLGLAPRADAGWEALAVDAPPDKAAELAEIARCLASISVNERIVWVLRHVEGFAMPEIAVHIGCSLSTVKRRLSAAEGRVAAYVEPKGGELV